MSALIVKFPNGEVWSVPAKVVARSYAAYYATRDTEKTEAQHVVDALSDADVLADWAKNNMNWGGELSLHARRLKEPEPADHDEMWGEAEIEVTR